MKQGNFSKRISMAAFTVLALLMTMGFTPAHACIPDGAIIESATLSVYVDQLSGDTVQVHLINAPWDENAVTYYSFNGSFEPFVEGSFLADGIGWRSVDVTSVVQEWVDGVVPNYGLLLEQGLATRVAMASSESSVTLRPMLEICYSSAGGTICETIQRPMDALDVVFDTTIDQRFPYNNFGYYYLMYAGSHYNYEKQALVRFEFDVCEPVDCETAFAFGGEFATCFLDIDEDGDGDGDFSRWGWTNGPLTAGFYSFEIYAGAGQCDLSKGTLVGMLDVNYDGSSATVTYTMYDGFTLDVTHLYVGSEILPRKKGNFTVAPGQYTTSHEDLNGASVDTFTIDGLSGDIYVVAHADVCGDFPE